jgi:hypothetical protein
MSARMDATDAAQRRGATSDFCNVSDDDQEPEVLWEEAEEAQALEERLIRAITDLRDRSSMETPTYL